MSPSLNAYLEPIMSDSDPFDLGDIPEEETARSLSAQAMGGMRPPYLRGLNEAQQEAIEALDGPVLVRALRSLLEAAARQHGEVLLHAHEEGGEITFAILDDRPEGPGKRAEEPLELQLARRDS